MKICFLLKYPDYRGAGLYFATLPLFKNLKIPDYNKHVFAFKNCDIKFSSNSYWGKNLSIIKLTTLVKVLKNALGGSQIIHLHGIWGWHSLFAYLLSFSSGYRVIISPHGMLNNEAVNRSSYKKNIAKKLYESRLWNKAACFHALNLSEAKCIKSIVPNANVSIIPNGVDIPAFDRNKINSVRKLLYIGRLDNKKGIVELLDAWEARPKDLKNISLHVAGKGEIEIEQRLSFLHNEGELTYYGAVYGEEKEILLEQCDSFILPSYGEGQPMTVLEAMSYGMTVFISPQCNMDNELRDKIALKTAPDINQILATFQRLASLSDAYMLQQAVITKKYVSDNYSWGIVSDMHLKNYIAISEGR